jgi:hypothetical protein
MTSLNLFSFYLYVVTTFLSIRLKRRSLRKGLENVKAHMKLSFVRDKYIPLKGEYIKSLNGRSNVQLMVAKYGV